MATHSIANKQTNHDVLGEIKTLLLKLRLSHRAILVADIAIVTVLLLLAVGAVGNIRFLSYQVGDQKVRVNASESQMLSAVNRAVADYKLQIKYPDGSVKSFSASNAGMSINKTATIDSLRHKEAIADHLFWWKPIQANLVFSTDQSKLSNFISQNATIITAKPSNASIKVSNGVIDVNKAKLGTEYGLENASATIQGQIATLNGRPLVLKSLSVSPIISDSQLAATISRITTVEKEHITIKVGDKTIVPSSKTIGTWLSIKTSNGKEVSLVVNHAAVDNYISNLAYSNEQVKRDQVTATLSNGSIAQVSQGQDGIYISGPAVGAAQGKVINNLLNGKDFSINLPVSSVPFSSITAGDWPKWIEVNLSTQRMYVYANGQSVRTFLVSTGKPSTPTPTGTFYINSKFTLQTMVGADYVQPDVPYINYFDNRGDAIHGNYWRPSYVFGNYGTSHGCVGLQVSDALWVYDWTSIGTPIVIHY